MNWEVNDYPRSRRLTLVITAFCFCRSEQLTNALSFGSEKLVLAIITFYGKTFITPLNPNLISPYIEVFNLAWNGTPPSSPNEHNASKSPTYYYQLFIHNYLLYFIDHAHLFFISQYSHSPILWQSPTYYYQLFIHNFLLYFIDHALLFLYLDILTHPCSGFCLKFS